MLRVTILEHARPDGPGKVMDWVALRGHSVQRVFLDEGHPLPELESMDMLIVLGGPMNIYEHEKHAWLVPEKAFLKSALDAGKPVLGICLGAQLMSDVLGGRVTRNPEKEVGWWPVTFSSRPELFSAFPERLMAFHWHGDTFSIPPGCENIASSEACANQVLVWGDRAVGLQFHIEIWSMEAEELMAAFPADMKPARYVQPAEQILAPPPETRDLERALFSLLDGLASKAAATALVPG